MRKLFISFLLITLILFATGCKMGKSEGFSFIESDVEFGENDYKRIVFPNNELGINLIKKVNRDDSNNLFISPMSLMMALSMVYNGSDGNTKEEIGKAINLPGIHADDLNKANASLVTKLFKDMSKISLNIANSIWLNDQYNFQEQFSENNKDYYRAKIEEIDISDNKSAKRINNWVKKETNSKIDEMVEAPLDEQLVTILLNAIYFKGQWKYDFDQKKTKNDQFYLEDGTVKEIPFMNLQEDLFYLESEYFQAVKLPYGEGEMSMDIFLPSSHITLDEFLEMFTSDHWNKWRTMFRQKEGTIFLPKFKLAYETSLNNALIELGMKDAFDAEKANFSKMIMEDGQIYISEVKQKSFIEVNEKGAEAAASTSVEMKDASAPVDGPFYMKVDRPFVFMINDEETGAILFIGLISNPK